MRESRNRAAVSPSPREAISGWVLEAIFSNGKQATITGFGTQSEANEWLGSARHVAWLRETRSAFSIRAVVAAFEYLRPYAAILTAAASECLQSARQSWRLQVYWRSIACRCLLAATGTLLIVSAVVAILAAALMPLGRSKQPARPGTPPMSAAAAVVPVRSNAGTQIPDPIAILIDRVSSSDAATEHPVEAVAENSAPQPAQDDGAAAEAPAATPRHDIQHAAPLGIVGIWAPETSSCAPRNAREGVLPAIISEHGARAGETSCIFQNRRQIKSDWRLQANCKNGREHWRSNVRLALKGDRLIWTSERGTQAYIRCRRNI